MQISAPGIAEIFAHEGVVPFRYRDSVAVDTFGVGHTAAAGAPDPKKMAFGAEHPLSEVVSVFRSDIRKFDQRVAKAVKVPLAQHEHDALVSFDFNTGGIVKANLTKALNDGNRAAAASGFMGWNKPASIIPRRRKEQALFSNGIYSSGGFASIVPADGKGRPLFAKGRRLNVMPAIASLMAANGADDKADDAKKGATAATGGAVATGGGSTQTPALPSGDGSLRLFLIVVAAILIAGALFYAWRWWQAKRAAKAHEAAAVAALAAAVATAQPPSTSQEPESGT